jgi:soluble lytic murein transglycosylase-like protein
VRGFVSVALLLAALPAVSWGQVRIERRADGTTLIVNEGRVHPARPVAERAGLYPVPESQWRFWIDEHARRNRLDPRLVRAVIQVESAYDTRAVSRKGARGLMQLMPETARDLAVSDPFDPEESIRGGTRYLRSMIDTFGKLELALAAYNAGPGVVRRFRGLPPFDETVRYVRRVVRLYESREPDLSVRLSPPRGRPVFVRRDADNRLVVTTEALR